MTPSPSLAGTDGTDEMAELLGQLRHFQHFSVGVGGLDRSEEEPVSLCSVVLSLIPSRGSVMTFSCLLLSCSIYIMIQKCRAM